MVDIVAVSKIVNLQTLIKHDIIPKCSSYVIGCVKNCTTSINADERSELNDEIMPQNTQELLGCNDALKHKVVL